MGARGFWDDQAAATRISTEHSRLTRKLDRYELAKAAEQKFESLSGGQQARFQILLLELSGATLLLLDEPTDNLDLESAEALEQGLDAFEGTVVAVTHDRWFARGFDRFLVFGADGSVYESDEPVWDEAISKVILKSETLREYYDAPITSSINGKASLPFDLDIIIALITFLKEPGNANPRICDAICQRLASLHSREKMF